MKGADKHCQQLAATSSSKNKQWHAYLSTSKENARDHIGTGPWFKSKGIVIVKNVDDLHSDNNKISKENALTESGTMINKRGDKTNLHDILMGSNIDGSAATEHCNNWTLSGAGTAIIGHHDKKGRLVAYHGILHMIYSVVQHQN